MRPPLIPRPHRSIPCRCRERGVTMVLVALAIVGIVAMAGLSIDIGTLYQASAEAQRAADAAALAAARTISMQGVTGDPNESQPLSWSQLCGSSTTSPAYLAAATAVAQNPISGTSTSPTQTVTYSYFGGLSSTDCSAVGGANLAGVNLLVTVQVTQTNLPTYFSRIWGRTGNTVLASATAEVFNPSNSGTYAGAGSPIPVQPRCVKPWIIPNFDPGNSGSPPSNCNYKTCVPWVATATGAITTPGIRANGGGVIGERFWMLVDCGATTPCAPPQNPPQANVPTSAGALYPPPNLDYLPGQAAFPAIAVPSDGTAACSNVAAATGYYASTIAGCDQSTSYQCGVPLQNAQLQNLVDLSENPGTTNDTLNGVECLIHESIPTTTAPSGQDALLPFQSPPSYPFQIQIGMSNPLLGAVPPVPSGSVITSSNSIVSFPIYDSSAGTTFGPGTTTPVTIIGFLQVFINVADQYGSLYVTVLNVSGCGNNTPNQPLYGTSPVPIRLITPP